ncbi:MAG TPA: glycosyltransferase family 2 protein [Gemmatimonadales bacterium]|nr:glycosyltransferase family 2 protein [Gemmatimonadales bacterium]
MTKPPRISVVIPVYEEEEILPELLRRVLAVLSERPGGPHELVLVDDGSKDSTWALIAEAAGRDPRVRGISLSRNFGHQTALTAALDASDGDVTIVMDGDLQDPPELIPALLAAWEAGNDVVYVQRAQRQEGPLLRLAYWAFYRLQAQLVSLAVPLDTGDFGLMSRRVVEEIRRTREAHRFLRGLRTWVGFRQTGIAAPRDSRAGGVSKYTFRRLVRLALDGVFAFSVVPLRAASAAGCLTLIGSVIFTAYAISVRLTTGRTPVGFTAIIALVVFLAGAQLLFLGIIGEYVGRVYEEVKHRPLYVIKDRAGRAG